MLWYEHKVYTSEYFAARLREMFHRARCSTRWMTAVAGIAVLAMTVANLGLIYAS